MTARSSGRCSSLQVGGYTRSRVPLAFAEIPDTVALIAWLHRDALIAALDREIDTEADDKAALSHEARQKAEAEVMGDLARRSKGRKPR